jgi:hypothetical protein
MNRFGLKRSIPTDVARTVRQRCGFGCVVCGSAIYDYDHFDPEFKDARTHDPFGIILLCPNHHREKGGFVGRTTLQRCAKAPFCKSSGFSYKAMDIDDLTIEMGPFIAEHCVTVLEVKSLFSINQIAFGLVIHEWVPLLKLPTTTKAIWFELPEEAGAPLRLNTIIYGREANALAWIENNVWHGSAQNLDITIVTGEERSKISIRGGDGNIILDLGFFPPNLIRIYKVLSYYNGVKIEIVGNADRGYYKRDDVLILSGSKIYSGYNRGAALSV